MQGMQIKFHLKFILKLLTVFVFLTISFLTGLSSESLARDLQCSSIFEHQTLKEKVEHRIDTKLEMLFTSKSEFYSLVIKDSEKVYGSTVFYFDAASKVLEIVQMRTYEQYRNLGVGNLMMEEIIRTFPNVKSIYSSAMEEKNHEVIEYYLKQGLKLEEAIKQTPAYKIRANVGFTEIVPDSINFKDGFTVTKPN